jgi:NDP-sugar pyrophosphorylase family protein
MPVAGKPVLEHVLRRLQRQGVQQVTLAVSYLEELIRTFFGDGSKYGLALDYYREETPLGTVGVLSLMDDLPDPCLVMNGDILTTIDVAAMARLHRERGSAMTVATLARTVQIDYGVLEIAADGKIEGYREKPELAYAVSAGVNLIGARARGFLRKNEHCHVPTLVARLLEHGEPVVAFQSTAYWRDIGRRDDYEAANNEFPGLEAEFRALG